MKINVLGTEYHLLLDEEMEEEDSDGEYSPFEKCIKIAPMDIEGERTRLYRDKVIRHEIIHAFLFESGLDDLSGDEMLVDWMALQIPKISKLFEEIGV